MSTRNVKLPVLLVVAPLTAVLLVAACATHPPAEVELPADEPEIVYVPEYPEPEPSEPSFVDYWLAKLTLEEKIGQLLMPRLPFGTTALNAAATGSLCRVSGPAAYDAGVRVLTLLSGANQPASVRRQARRELESLLPYL